MDYDVAVLGLSSPPAQAVVTSYRPAVSVRNNGIHNAIASGYLRIYAAGLLIFETEVYSGTIAPGATGTADGIDYWTPPAEGTYIVNGYVTTPLDQLDPNNNLSPTTIIVSGGEPPVPPTVPLHAAQHEEGGDDPLNVDGLPGVLADLQPAQPHAAQHQAGGIDTINVAGLAGVLGEAQTPAVHGNAHHSPTMATSTDLTTHAGAASAHTAATNLANRELSGDLAGLVPNSQIAIGSHLVDPGDDTNFNALLADRFYGAANPVHHAAKHEFEGPDQITAGSVSSKAASIANVHGGSGYLVLATFYLKKAQLHNQAAGHVSAIGSGSSGLGATQKLRFSLYDQSTASTLVYVEIPIPASSTFTLAIDVDFAIDQDMKLLGMARARLTPAPPGSISLIDYAVPAPIQLSDENHNLALSFGWSGAPADSVAAISNATALIVAQIQAA